MSFFIYVVRVQKYGQDDMQTWMWGTTYKKTRTQECGDICRYFKNYIGIIIHSKENEYIFIYL